MPKITVYTVETSVPVPTPASASVPIRQLGVGESILFDRALRNTVASNASKLKVRHGMEFTIRLVDDTHCRIWRAK